MSACMRLPSRMGTMTLRSIIATDSSSCSMALRRAMVAASPVVRACDWANVEDARQTKAMAASLNLECIVTSRVDWGRVDPLRKDNAGEVLISLSGLNRAEIREKKQKQVLRLRLPH